MQTLDLNDFLVIGQLVQAHECRKQRQYEMLAHRKYLKPLVF